METDVAAFAATYKQFMEVMIRDTSSADLTDIGTEVTGFLGVGLSEVDPLVEMFPAHQVVDLDAALERVRTEGGGRLIGVSGGVQRSGLDSFAEFLEQSHWNFRPGAAA